MALSDLNLDTEYRSAQSALATTFYRWCLSESVRYDRAAGYFSSTVFLIVGANIVEFAKKGGKIRLLCSPQLSAEDIQALNDGHAKLEDLASHALLEEISTLEASKASEFPLRVLSTLVATGGLEIQIAVRAAGHGIFHEKLGIFADSAENKVTFLGSSNETWRGWHPEGNYEAIEVFCSWSGDGHRVAKHVSHFETLWHRQDRSLHVIDFPEAVRRKLCDGAASSLDDLTAPHKGGVPRRPTPRRHQGAAIDAWIENGFRGIFKHATGSGKTLTACFAMEPHLADGGVVLVLVPSRLLLKQWNDELSEFFDHPNVMLIGAGNNEWKRPGTLKSFSSTDRLLGGRIILSTMQTARSDNFIGKLRQGKHLLIIADEVHQVGSTENSKILQIEASKRLGLSATPERFGDALGTQRLLDYFGEITPPEYSLADAINDGHLVRYEYTPSVVSLTPDEVNQWRKLSLEISVASARERAGRAQDGDGPSTLDRLLIKRARVAKKAEAKMPACDAILQRNYRAGQRWLVYCEDQEQLREVVTQTKQWCKDVLEYHTGMVGDPQAALQWFENEGGILVAIACLDEGINIPCISHALILASSQNPRQFIQRRGRILRKFAGKQHAAIFDVLVTPENVDDEPTQKSLLKSELRRAIEFAGSARNQSGSAALRLIALKAGIDPNSLDDSGSESEIEQIQE